MSIVRYTNKKTGWVSIYESKSCYDPITKKSRPKRKYIGHEDPITKEFIPTTGKAGRKRITPTKSGQEEPASSQRKGSYYEPYKRALAELDTLRNDIKIMSKDIQTLCDQLDRAHNLLDQMSETSKSIRERWQDNISSIEKR